MKWMPNYDYRENFDLFQSRLSNSILEVQELIQVTFIKIYDVTES